MPSGSGKVSERKDAKLQSRRDHSLCVLAALRLCVEQTLKRFLHLLKYLDLSAKVGYKYGHRICPGS
jgi:hypothetical protein